MSVSTLSPRSLALWQDRTGAFSPVRALALLLAVAPALPLIYRAAAADLGPRPLTEISHVTGLWAIRLLAATFAVTPLIELTRWTKLAPARRILGVAVFAWMVAHLFAFFADKSFDAGVIAHELVARVYLLIGLVAFLLLAALAATSTDAAIRRLGPAGWKRLHRLIYVIVALGLVHFFMQAKLEISEPTAVAGMFLLLAALRLPRRAGLRLGPLATLALGLGATAATAAAEAGWFAYAMGAPFGAVIASDFSLDLGVRPCWAPLILATGLAAVGAVARVASARRAAAARA